MLLYVLRGSRFMRLQKTVLFCLINSVFFSGFSFASEINEESGGVCSSLTATGNPEYPPFLWRGNNKDDQLLGANKIIIDELSRRINIPITLKSVGPWSKALSAVKNGRVDMIAGAFYTNSRASYMDYFYPVMLHTTSVVWQRKGETFPFHSKKDLQGKWGVTVISNSFGQAFDSYARQDLNILSVASLSNAFQMLMADSVDYVLYEKNPGIAYVTMLGLQKQITYESPSISSEGLYLTLSKASSCNTVAIKQKIAMALSQMHKQGIAEKALFDGIKEWRAFQTTDIALLKK